MTRQNKNQTEDNLIPITLKLLRLLQVPVTSKFVNDIKLRPEYPSLLAISNGLRELNVKNIVIEISADQLSEISFPAIAQLRTYKGNFIIILKIENDVVRYLNDNLQPVQVPFKDFVLEWTGILMLAEASEKSGETEFKEKRNREVLSNVRYASLTILSVAILSVLFFLQPTFGFPVLMNVLGIGLCVTLLMQSLGHANLLSMAVCRPNSKTDCDQVINSSAAKIYGDISLSEIGLLFFAGGLFTNVILALKGYPVFNSYLFSVLILSLPFTIFSVYYQWRIIKAWCAICLGVMGLLWAGAIFYGLNYSSFHFDAGELISVFIGYSLPLVIWFVIRPSIIQAQSVPSLQQSIYKFTKSQNVFDALSQQRQVISDGLGHAVILGNPEAKHTITLVTSPTCGPCIKAHHQIEPLLHHFEENLKIAVHFAVNPNDNGSIPNTVARNLISLALNGDDRKMKEAMGKWYNPKRPELKTWLSSLPAQLHPGTEEHFAKHYEWCEKHNITAVPAIYFDGKQIPNEYSFEDFENILRLKLTDE